MPMRDPTENTGGFEVPAVVVPNAMFVGTFSGVECRDYKGPPHYNQDGTQKQEYSIVWKFTLREHDSLEEVLGSDGAPYEMWRFTSDATSLSSQGREILHAMAGREVSNAEVAQLLAADPDHMPTKLLGRSVLLIMTQYRDKMGTNRVGIGQVLALSASDRARVEALRGGREPGPAPKAQARSEGRMGPPAQQFTSSGQPVRPKPAAPEPVGVADGSADLPW